VDVGDRGKLVSDLPRRGDRVEVTKIVIVAWRFRTDVRRCGDDKLLVIEMQPNPAMECRRVVIVVDAGVHAARGADQHVEPLGRVKSKERAGVVEWDAEVENVSVRIKRI